MHIVASSASGTNPHEVFIIFSGLLCNNILMKMIIKTLPPESDVEVNDFFVLMLDS